MRTQRTLVRAEAPSAGGGFWPRLREAMPARRTALAGSLLWGAAMGASALASLLFVHWETLALVRSVVVLFAVGGALAFPLACTIARMVSRGRNRQTAFAAALVSFTTVTIGLTALIYALQYRRYYAEWHADPFTVTWTLQFVFTGLVALYQFAVLGIRLYIPLGMAALFAAALWFARRSR